MASKTTAVVLIAAMMLSGCASVGQMLSADQNQKRYELKDGSILIVDANGRMRMFNIYGDPVYMKDGVAMESQDGSVIVMKENALWKALRTRGTLSPRS